MLRLALCLMLATAAFASNDVFAPATAPTEPRGPVVALDDQCVVDFYGYVYGTHSGNTQYPGGNTQFRLAAFCFLTNNCPSLPDTFYTYCTDLNHPLFEGPYCVDINECVVDGSYPLVTPAMAYLLSTYDVVDAQTDRIKQLAVWKLSEDHSGGANDGIPYVHINDGRGYPNVGDAPVFPYVNTVLNTDPLNNDPANLLVLDALGYDTDLNPTGVAKNVVNCGDEFLIATEPVVIDGGVATVCATITLVRGAHAVNDLNNTSVSGVWVDLAELNNVGTLSTTGAFTDATGNVYVCISQPVENSYQDVRLQVCSEGLWPTKLDPCPGDNSQSQILVNAQGCEVCVTLDIPGDNFLPVELASFSATAVNGGISVAWSTASETNLDRFEVTRNGSAVDIVSASNNVNGATYSYFDADVTMGVEYTYELVCVSLNGEREVLATQSATPSATTTIVSEFALHQNYPNPFNPTTSIRFDLAEASEVTLKVFNVAGQEVANLVSGNLVAGAHTVSFDGATLTSGVYLYRLTAGEFTQTQKMMLLK
ncbi:MAG: T9SS type A sorting domain-containing protein [Calditrichaeota bacterium]|nr:T9SS type A sorting domain-containing protein [Calditrichota bacterium]